MILPNDEYPIQVTKLRELHQLDEIKDWMEFKNQDYIVVEALKSSSKDKFAIFRTVCKTDSAKYLNTVYRDLKERKVKFDYRFITE